MHMLIEHITEKHVTSLKKAYVVTCNTYCFF